MINRNLEDLVRSPATTTQPALNRAFRSGCLTKSKPISCRSGFMTQYDQLDRKDLECMVCRKHTEGTPLCPILSMTGLSHHELGKWLASLLQPVLERFSSHCISDSFTFAKTMQNLDIDPNVFMCSFDVSSLFTNVLVDETIKICSEALYDQSFQRTCLLN